MNVFNLLAVIAGLAAIGTFLLGSRAVARDGAAAKRCDDTRWTWHSAFTFFVFLTILAAPLSR